MKVKNQLIIGWSARAAEEFERSHNAPVSMLWPCAFSALLLQLLKLKSVICDVFSVKASQSQLILINFDFNKKL
jgi:hypothetical protein